MPVVTRSDCTQADITEDYTFVKDPSAGITASIDAVTVAFNACQGANNQNNDLTAHVQQLVDDGKLSTTEQGIFQERVVGNNQCNSVRDNLLEGSSYSSGFNIDDDKWTYIVGE